MQLKRLSLKNAELAPIFAVLVATLYVVFGGFIVSGAAQILCFGVIVLACVAFFRIKRFSGLDLLWIISLLPFAYCIQEWNLAAIRDIVAYLTFVVIVVFIKTEKSNLEKAVRLLLFMAFFHLFFVFLNVAFKTQFTALIFRLLDPSLVTTYNRAVSGNYYCGLGYIPGDTSGYFVTGILILLFYNTVLRRRYPWIGIGFLLIGILLCAKRSHLICLFFALMITWVLAAQRGGKLRRFLIVSIALLSVLTAGYFLLPYFSNIPMVSRISDTIEKLMAGSDFTSNRTSLTAQAMRLFRDQKMLGIGWKGFNRYTNNLWGNTNYVNNVYVQLLVETGIVGAVLFISPMLFSFISTLKKLTAMRGRMEEAGTTGAYLQLSLALQLFFLIYCVFEIPFYDYTFLLVYGLAIAMSNCVSYQEIRQPLAAVQSEQKPDGRIRTVRL